MLPYLSVLLLVAAVIFDIFAAAFVPPPSAPVDTSCPGRLLSLCSHGQYRGGDRNGPDTEIFETSVIVTTKVLLPGETTTLTIKADKQASIYDAVQASMDKDGRSFLTLGVQVFANDLGLEEEEDDNDDFLVDNELENVEATTMTQVASYCEFLKCQQTATNYAGEVDLEVQCIARIRLLDMILQPRDAQSALRFQAQWVPEASIMTRQELQHAAAICRSIDSLMQKTSKMQETITMQENNEPLTATSRDAKTTSNNMWQEFEATRDKVSRALREDLQREHGVTTSDSIVDFDHKLHLVATSWTIFTCLADSKLEARYRLRALDWDNLLERLKLGLYALREMQILLQGQLLSLSETSDMPEDSGCIITPSSSSDAFQ